MTKEAYERMQRQVMVLRHEEEFLKEQIGNFEKVFEVSEKNNVSLMKELGEVRESVMKSRLNRKEN